jgi:hypothetical protein
MHHPEVDQRNPWGYSIHWQEARSPQVSRTPWGKICLVLVGSALLCFATGYLIASRLAAGQVELADRRMAEAEKIKANASGDLDQARSKISEQQARLRKVNDCIYSALNEPIESPIPTP